MCGRPLGSRAWWERKTGRWADKERVLRELGENNNNKKNSRFGETGLKSSCCWSSAGTAELAQELWGGQEGRPGSLTQCDLRGHPWWPRLCAPTAEGVAATPGQGTKDPTCHAPWQKKRHLCLLHFAQTQTWQVPRGLKYFSNMPGTRLP